MKAMKLLVIALVAVGLVAADTATGDHQPDTTAFGQWRSCMKTKIPSDKIAIMDGCVNKPGGTDMSKFRRGLECVLKSYNIVENNKVDLKKMSTTAASVNSPELKKAFTECPKEERNANLNRSVKCVIDHLETSCPKKNQPARG